MTPPTWCYSLGSLPFLHCECAMFGGVNGGNGVEGAVGGVSGVWV